MVPANDYHTGSKNLVSLPKGGRCLGTCNHDYGRCGAVIRCPLLTEGEEIGNALILV
jgi:hypothetical protein